jgi:hypothetical protein
MCRKRMGIFYWEEKAGQAKAWTCFAGSFYKRRKIAKRTAIFLENGRNALLLPGGEGRDEGVR